SKRLQLLTSEPAGVKTPLIQAARRRPDIGFERCSARTWRWRRRRICTAVADPIRLLRRMTKPVTDFAEEDLAMAHRALWSLEWPSRMGEEPPRDLDLARPSNFRAQHGALDPWRTSRSFGQQTRCSSGHQNAGVTSTDAAKCESQRHAEMREE